MNPDNCEEEEDTVEEIIVRRLEAFHKAHLDAEGYKILVVEDNNYNNNLTSHQIMNQGGGVFERHIALLGGSSRTTGSISLGDKA